MNQIRERHRAVKTVRPATIFDLRETPGRRSSRTWPTRSTAHEIPTRAKVSSQGRPGGSGTSEGKLGILERIQRSNQTFSTVIENKPEERSQVKLR